MTGAFEPYAMYDPERHEALAARAWDAGVVRAAIDVIVADTRAAYTPNTLWPVHSEDQPGATTPFHSLYFGAAGIVWALDYLASVGACAGFALRGRVDEFLVPNRQELADDERRESLLLGDAGILLAQWRHEPSPEVAEALARAIAANADNPALELMWGAPGTMLAALAMHEATGEQRWIDLYRASATELLRHFVPNDETGCALWTQDLWGRKLQMLGAVHGFASNAVALIRGRAFLEADVWRRASREIAATFAKTALRDEAGWNWPPQVEPPKAGRKMLVQHCHGAPGMVVCLVELPEPIDDLLLAAGETTWRAGPLKKGSNLCHGTGGNGYAFLKLFKRTGDELWLARARAFAMHAIAQSDADAARHGMRRYSLWTGDLGLAVYLHDCLEARAAFPTMDVF